MAEKNSLLVPRGFPGLKRKLSNLVRESSLRSLTKKSKKANKRNTTGTLTLQDIHEGLELPKDLKDFSFDYSDGDSFRYSFVGSEIDRETSNTQMNRFSFVSSRLEKELEAGIKVNQVIPDSMDEDEDENITSLPQRNTDKRTSKLSSFYGIDRPTPQLPRISLETPSPERKREPLLDFNRQISANPLERSRETKPNAPPRTDDTMRDVPSRFSSNRRSMGNTPETLALTLSQETVAQEASAVSVKRYSVPTALDVKTPTSPTKREPLTPKDSNTPVKVKKHEIKTVNLLKPVESSENPAARKVSQEIEKINTGSNAHKRMSMPNTPTYPVGKRSSVADIRQSLLAKASTPASAQPGSALPSSSVPSRQSSLRNSRSLNQETNKRFSTPVSLNHVMATQPPTSSTRRDSSSTTTASRLSWLKTLEENAGKNPGRDMVFQKLQGGVAAKLAKFEQQNLPLDGRVGRSNSTVSRASEAYSIEAGSSFIGKRSSIAESTASTAATGYTSVLGNFDEGFRAKMESLAGSLVDKATKDKENEPSKGAAEASKKLQEATSSKTAKGVPRDVIDMINLSGADPEVAINDYVGHGDLGRTRILEEDLKRVSLSDEPVVPAPQRAKSKARVWTPPAMPTLDTLLNTPPSTPTATAHAQSPTAASPTSDTSSPSRKTKAGGLSILVGGSASNSPVSPARLMADINSPPCAATFATLSSEALPLAKDEMTPGPNAVAAAVLPEEMKTGSPIAESFNAAALPSFVAV